jgi:hypothetical protein
MNITFPQNAATFYSFIANVSSFELIPTDRVNHAVFRFTEQEYQEVDPNFSKMGFSS